jgi:CysZ protein
MSFFFDFFQGMATHARALPFVFRHRLWRYFFFPFILSGPLIFLGFFSLFALGSYAAHHATERPGEELKLVTDLPGGSALKGLPTWALDAAEELVLAVLLFSKVFRYIVLILFAQMMAALSKKTDEIITGRKFDISLGRRILNLLRALALVLRNLFMDLLIAILCLLLACTPVIGWLAAPVMVIAGWYFAGFSMMDYVYEHRRMPIRDGVRFTRRHKGIAIGTGMIFSLLMQIPVIGLSLACVLSPVAATLATKEALERAE